MLATKAVAANRFLTAGLHSAPILGFHYPKKHSPFLANNFPTLLMVPQLQRIKSYSGGPPEWKERIEHARAALDSIQLQVEESYDKMSDAASILHEDQLEVFNAELWALLEAELRHSAREKCGGMELADKEATLDLGLQLFRDDPELSRTVFSCYRGFHQHRYEEDSYESDCPEKLNEVMTRLAEMPPLGEQQLQEVLTGLEEERARMQQFESVMDGADHVDEKWKEITAKCWKVFDLAVQKYARENCNIDLAEGETRWFSEKLFGFDDKSLVYHGFRTNWWPTDPVSIRLHLKFISFLLKRLERMPAMDQKELEYVASRIQFRRKYKKWSDLMTD